MRKLAVFPMAGLLALAISAPAMAGPNVTNASGSARVMNGEWYSDGGYGSVYLVTDSGYGAWGEFVEESGEWIPCDETGEYYGFVGVRTSGWTGDLSITLDSRLEHGSASGTLELYTATVNECTGEYAGPDEPTTVAFTAELDGVGRAVRFRGNGSFSLPGEVNSHSSQSGKERPATGSIDLGDAGSRSFDGAILATYSWREHSNN